MKRKIFTRFLSLLFVLFLALTSACACKHKLIPKHHCPPVPSFYVPEKIHVALVLGSGGVRGMAHVGVIEELEAAGIKVDLIVGCSAGSIVGALYADNPNICDVKTAIWGIKTDSLLDFDFKNCRYGLSQGKGMQRTFDEYLNSDTFDQLKIPLVIVATDLNSGELVPIGYGDVATAARASCSLPFFFVPCQHLGRVFVDGGIINPVPVKVARDLGAELIIAVDLCELLTRTYPSNLLEVITRCAEIEFMWQNDACSRSADVIIRPKTCDVGTFAKGCKRQLYEAGKRAAREQIPYILEKIHANKCDEDSHPWRLVEPKCYVPEICED